MYFYSDLTRRRDDLVDLFLGDSFKPVSSSLVQLRGEGEFLFVWVFGASIGDFMLSGMRGLG